MVPPKEALAGMTLYAPSPAACFVTLTTAVPSGDVSRETSACMRCTAHGLWLRPPGQCDAESGIPVVMQSPLHNLLVPEDAHLQGNDDM